MLHRLPVQTRLACVLALIALAAGRTLGDDAHGHSHAAPPASPAAVAAPVAPAAAAAATHAAGIAGGDAVKMLADGNARFVAGSSKRPHQGQARLCDTFANGQHPYAAVLSCADSRVPPELVFDAGIGDLFVVRVAGNVADVDEVGTLEYGVEHLGINAVLVLGHTKCGAVTAVVDGAHVTKNIELLVDNIVPAADDARRAFPHLSGPQLVGKAIEMNVRRQMADLVSRSDVLRAAAKAGTLKIVGGVYDLHTGEVNWIEGLAPSVATAAAPTVIEIPAPAAAKAGDAHAAPTVVAPAKNAHGDPRAKPAAHAPADKDAHGAASHGDAGAHGKAGHSHGKAADAHGAAAKADGHGSGAHAAPATTMPSAAVPEKKENFLALGGLLVGGCGVSYGVLHFMMKARPPEQVEPAAAADAKPADVKPAV